MNELLLLKGGVPNGRTRRFAPYNPYGLLKFGVPGASHL